MFGKKKETNAKPKRDHTGKNLAQYGLFDMPGSFDEDDVDLGGDSDLEAELLALANDNPSRPKKPIRRKPEPAANLDVMIAESLKDIPSDEELSGDDDDPDLLNELSEITGETDEPVEAPTPVQSSGDTVKLLQERLQMYTAAESNAAAANDTSRARRFNRGIKTIKDLLRSANAGGSVNVDDIPPEVSVTVRKPPTVLPPVLPKSPTSEPIPQPEPSEEPIPQPEPSEMPIADAVKPQANRELLTKLTNRREEYKAAALRAKKSGDAQTAISYIKIVKQFEVVVRAVEAGEPVDLSKMPGPPQVVSISTPKVEECETQGASAASPEPNGNQIAAPALEEDGPPVELITASSVAEALQQRLAVYKQQEEKAKEEGNTSKARRMGRIVKQFEQAIKQNKAGKPIPFDELPTPPGYAPIPGTVKPPPPETPPQPAVPDAPASPPSQKPPSPSKPPMIRQNSASARISGNHMPTTRTEKQVLMLMARQKEFKEAALNAKRKGEIAQAKEYLRTAKQFDPLIEAAHCGLPVDMNSLPISAAAKSELDESYEVILAEECEENDPNTLDALTRLEEQLTKQLKLCISTRDHHKALGDVAGTNRFEHMALLVTRDLDVIRLARRTVNSDVPKFHYETKCFNIVKSFTELGDNDLQLSVLRGINYSCANPKDVDTYVKFEFPFPQEETYKDRTVTVKDSNNPEYNADFTVPIQRSSRACQRVFKRHSIKMEIYSKGGLFRGDTLLGTVLVKLQPLETRCELHDSFDLMDGRKKIGGKLEVRVRVRHPLLTRQVEQLSEKWLVIDR